MRTCERVVHEEGKPHIIEFTSEGLQHFAKLVAESEREECAKILDDRAKRKNDGCWADSEWITICNANELAADAIRQRRTCPV